MVIKMPDKDRRHLRTVPLPAPRPAARPPLPACTLPRFRGAVRGGRHPATYTWRPLADGRRDRPSDFFQ